MLSVQPVLATFIVPNFPDTTIKTRVTHGLQPPAVVTLRLKGPRDRKELEPFAGKRPGTLGLAHISQCDRKAWVTLYGGTKTYRVFPIHDFEENGERRLPPPNKKEGPVVTVSTDSEDTGERREMGAFQARHIKSIVKVEPSRGASTVAREMDVDGWYIDLSGVGCLDIERGERPPFNGWFNPGSGDTFKYVKTGNATVGYAVEETSTIRSEGNAVVNKIELLEFSNKTLDEALFEIPDNYSEAPKQILNNVPIRPYEPQSR